jgi:hypothetical protein
VTVTLGAASSVTVAVASEKHAPYNEAGLHVNTHTASYFSFRETQEGTKDRTDKEEQHSLTEDTPRGAVTNALCLHLHNFACKTFKIKRFL